MSIVTLKKLSLINFKGIRNLTIDFDSNTNIYGDNGTGKTTVFDSFVWLLFGKDSTDRKDFEIKTLDSNNMAIPKIEHEVSAELEVNGELVILKRVFKEKWVKTKGALEAEFSGNETLYYWNDVPLSMKEFGNKVSEILDEKVFKLITSPSAFNMLKWQERRDVLVKIAGDVSDADLAAGNSDYLALLSQLTNKSLDEYKKQIAATIKKAKDDIKMIPTRIDEVERSKPEAVDEEMVNSVIYAKEKEIASIDNQLQDKAAAYDEVIKKRNENQDKIYDLKSKQNGIRFTISEQVKSESKSETSKADSIRSEIHKKDSEELVPAQQKVDRLKSERNEVVSMIERFEKIVTSKREEWNTENSKTFTFSEENAVCPTCGHAMDASEIEEKRNSLQENFNTNKANRLSEISAEGKGYAEKVSSYRSQLSDLDSRIDTGEQYIKGITAEITKLRSDLLLENDSNKPAVSNDVIISQRIEANEEYQQLSKEIANLESLKFEINDSDDNTSQLKIAKGTLQNHITDLKSSLQANVQIANADKRIAELQDEESKLAQQIADIEKTQFTIESFIKLKVDTIESMINKKFSFVKFKLFETQINGGQVECCEALINGVPFSDANTASKINAGIDIINTLCEFYQVSAPIFIDNRESVVKLIDSNSQIINLIVSPEDKKLRVS
ncbi:AAA family ATPase [Epilithonimonas caeni]|uniref:AAA family ATPase n=1 Tax=Epilithonimonas caeni TaxID=365343 RepID=UPI0004168D1F|nr:AAA family ATPase [Epilithonimonas caeni]